MRIVFILSVYLLSKSIIAQEAFQYINGTVENDATGFPMESVHILNLNNVIGTTTDNKGKFEIPVQINDTLYFSYLGYKSLKVAVTNDMIKFENSKFQLTELAFALEEIILRPYLLTGYLDIDVKSVPVNNAGRFNPADFLHNLFGKKGVQMQKLKKMRESYELKNLLAIKFDREILVELLNLERIDLDEILRNCNYSDIFIKESNDLQILEAISQCYDEYRVLKL